MAEKTFCIAWLLKISKIIAVYTKKKDDKKLNIHKPIFFVPFTKPI